MSQGMSYVTVMLTAGSHLVCVYKLQPTTGFFFLHTPHLHSGQRTKLRLARHTVMYVKMGVWGFFEMARCTFLLSAEKNDTLATNRRKFGSSKTCG